MSALICGVDIGSTNVKVILVDQRARAVWTKAVPTPRVPDESGVATDVLRLVAMIEEMIIEGWRVHGQSLPLRAIAVVGGIGAGERSATEFLLCRAGGTRHRIFSNGGQMAMAPRKSTVRSSVRRILDNTDRLSSRRLDGSPVY
jgi:hypothetical protein